jgi:hypothetical protein
MIIYNEAFDLYHTVYRLLKILTYFNRDDYVELDRLRIWDFYLLFPQKIHEIRFQRNESDIKNILKRFIPKRENPYEEILESRKIFEKIRPYQVSALHSLASYGIVDKKLLLENRVTIISKERLLDEASKLGELSESERNLIKIMTSHYFLMPMHGKDGLKDKTGLITIKYDAK